MIALFSEPVMPDNPAELILFDRRIVLPSLKDLGGGRPPYDDDGRPADDYDPELFKRRIAAIFPKGASARLARVADVNQRLAQRWIVGDAVPPYDVQDYAAEQAKLIEQYQPMRALVQLATQWQGLDSEVAQSQIAALYHQISGRDPE